MKTQNAPDPSDLEARSPTSAAPTTRFKIVEIDLAAPIESIPQGGPNEGVFLLFRVGETYLGHNRLLCTELPAPASRVAYAAAQTTAITVGDLLRLAGFKAKLPSLYQPEAINRPPSIEAIQSELDQGSILKKLSASALASSPAAESVSLVICTRNRAESLAKTLDSVAALQPPPFETIVVDNAPTDSSTQAVVSKYPNINYCIEPKPGLSQARNKGIEAASGAIISYTDDDVRLPTNWIKAIADSFADSQTMATTGLMLPAELRTEAQIEFQKNSEGDGWGYRPRHYTRENFLIPMRRKGAPVWKIGAGANMAFRRSIFAKVGGFDPRLGAGASGCSEDSEMWYRILESGHDIRYDPRAVVFHTHRETMAELSQQMRSYLKGHVVALVIQFLNFGHLGDLRRLLLSLPWYYTRLSVLTLLGIQKTPNLLPSIRGFMSGIAYCLSLPFRHPSRTKATASIK
ncbi:glycosyltransferase [Pelagicoccus sp. SDUM812002]|uniref:glycosyltransferase family 2 protein n=1 Tax=Pelagicoccus sp. SDUM812002 TaxID=3041266 RepID=UPI00280CEB38|nr:glycosyltransferase [Pelagicoccus sp. SDUM812002]